VTPVPPATTAGRTGDPFGTDLHLRLLHHTLRPVYTVATRGNDLAVVGGAGSLAQALIIRLLTPRGEMAALGHPDYGSRLNELIGQPNTATRRNLATLYVLEALRDEPRVAKVTSVEVTTVPGTGSLVRITVRLQPAGTGGELVVGPFELELQP
jgi:phage baseplate assembly protein W